MWEQMEIQVKDDYRPGVASEVVRGGRTVDKS